MATSPAYLFGSYARGDSNQNSDIDLLIISEKEDKELESSIVKKYFPHVINSLTFSYYSENKIKNLFKNGDLFAWHLYKESILLSGEDVIKNQGTPSEYKLMKRDILPLAELFISIKEMLSKEGSSLCYEAGLMFLCIRNIGHSLSWLNPTGPSFVKSACQNLPDGIPILPLSNDDFLYLMEARIASTRANISFHTEAKRLNNIYNKLENWIIFIEDYVKKGKYE